MAACSGSTAKDGVDGSHSGSDSPAADIPTATTTQAFQLLGKVVDSTGSPVPDAIVTAGGVSTVTAPDGWFDMTIGTNRTEVVVSKPAWGTGETTWDGSAAFVSVAIEPLKIRALRVNGAAARDDHAFAELLDIADDTAVNGLAFDTKQEGGTVLYDTRVKDAHDMGAVVSGYDPVQRIGQAKEHGLYVITRIVTFEDAIRAQHHPDEVLAGRWLDPTNEAAWEYPLALAAEACDLGFDEIQFDYVRFPSGEAVETSGQLEMTQDERVGAIAAFLERAREMLHPMGCAVSADVFGVILATSNDQGIGQRPEELTRQLDAFSPMVYPSHYADGWRGLAEPNDHPYDVTSDALEDALERIDPGTVLRPWLQSFWWTNEQIRRSIQAAEDAGVGWILWNALSNFDRSAIPTDSEVSG